MKKLYFDWSGKFGLHVVTDEMPFPKDEKEAVQFAINYDNFDHLLANLYEPHLLHGESTYESFLPGRRERVTNMIYNAGHDIRVFSPRATPKFRRNRTLKGIGIVEMVSKEDKEKKRYLPKTDAVDAFCIRELSKTLYLKPPTTEINQTMVAIREDACEQLKIMRNSRVRISDKLISLKDYYAELISEQLPSLNNYNEVTQLCLGNSNKKYNLVIIADIAALIRRVKTTDEFERVAGFHQNGYPNQIRSDLYWHRWGKRFTDPDKKHYGKVTLSGFRKEVRRLFHLLQERVDWSKVDEKINPYMDDIKNNTGYDPIEKIEVKLITPDKKPDFTDKVFCNPLDW
jgi:hypothetical protein